MAGRVHGLCRSVQLLGVWWFVTSGPVGKNGSFSRGFRARPRHSRPFTAFGLTGRLTRNLLTTLRRLTLGFGLAALVGVPLGVLCGCFPRVQAFFMPMTLFGRNIPVAALIPLTFSLFGIGEAAKSNVHFHRHRRVRRVGYNAGHRGDRRPVHRHGVHVGRGHLADHRQGLAAARAPSVFNSLRLIFGLAFGYIMLAEVIKFGGEAGGLGDLINTSQRRGPREHILLILLIIPVVALFIDRLFYFVQAELFPYRYGGMGILHRLVRGILHVWEDVRLAIWNGVRRLLGRAIRLTPPTHPHYEPSNPQPVVASSPPAGEPIGMGRVLTGVRDRGSRCESRTSSSFATSPRCITLARLMNSPPSAT